MKRIVSGVCCLFFLFAIQVSTVFAEYVLPYPSTMPGSKFYQLHLAWEKISKFWYFGDLAQIRYHRELSDKYLVEAKTLFEYKQYLLGDNALHESNTHYKAISQALQAAGEHEKNTSEQETVLNAQRQKHIEVLSSLKLIVPEKFTWVPEKKPASLLRLHENIEQAIQFRETHE